MSTGRHPRHTKIEYERPECSVFDKLRIQLLHISKYSQLAERSKGRSCSTVYLLCILFPSVFRHIPVMNPRNIRPLQWALGLHGEPEVAARSILKVFVLPEMR
ncbi:hypothetical protein ARMSODRAFT_621275 [Armillaria solidipes]|uniref:Uncharacterized protein n=1 Tax=Armillaria solidipes TaxID=1076256 RepID=A0A2H3AYN3_9AGAR|nr:hypothetical protein ARMSODRAFT_621275 [Armillaria solidipes]